VYVDQGTGRIEHKPYRKARNHLERIPWISSHPKDVKKGTFVGEMSRLATLSSTPGNYLEAMDHLKKVYIARGYPPELIKSWLKDNTSKRWANRLSTAGKRVDVFVLKSHFNPVWKDFNIHELGQLVNRRWAEFLELQDDLNRQLEDHERSLGFLSDTQYAEGSRTHPDGRSGNTSSLPQLSSEIDAYPSSGTSALGSSREADVWITIRKRIGRTSLIEELKILDIRKLGFDQRKWLVSRKRNFNLADLVSMLKQAVLYNISDNDIIADGVVDNWD
jgi:hypothetical protein